MLFIEYDAVNLFFFFNKSFWAASISLKIVALHIFRLEIEQKRDDSDSGRYVLATYQKFRKVSTYLHQVGEEAPQSSSGAGLPVGPWKPARPAAEGPPSPPARGAPSWCQQRIFLIYVLHYGTYLPTTQDLPRTFPESPVVAVAATCPYQTNLARRFSLPPPSPPAEDIIYHLPATATPEFHLGSPTETPRP